MNNAISRTNTPIIYRIFQSLAKKGAAAKCSIHLSELFAQFVLMEEYDDDSMEEEFGDGQRDDSFFMDWIADNYINVICHSEHNTIWNELNRAYNTTHQDEIPMDNCAGSAKSVHFDDAMLLVCGYAKKYGHLYPFPEDVLTLVSAFLWLFFRVYNPYVRHSGNIIFMWVTDDSIQCMKNVLDEQCQSLQICNNPTLYTMLQIGKQNGTQPLLQYFVDAYNRFRVTRAARFRKKYGRDKEFYLIFERKFSDISPERFIFEKCTGLDLLLSEHSEAEIEEFKMLCVSAISTFCRQLLCKPPMSVFTAQVTDSVEVIGLYIFQAYSFVQDFISKQSAPLPFQIDIVIIPKRVRCVNLWNECESVISDHSDSGFEIGDIEQRLKGQQRVLKCMTNHRTAAKAMLKCAESVIGKRTHQRAVIIIDRRLRLRMNNTSNDDRLYCYQTKRTKKCHSFESSPELSNLSLFANSRNCLLPKLKNEETDIGICSSNPFGITLSFHCFDVSQVSVYLGFDGWVTRFDIEDCRTFLPGLFMDRQQQILASVFRENSNPDFLRRYQASRGKCADTKFETWFNKLMNGN